MPGKAGPELELTYNFGVGSYELGTAYGHIALTVENVAETLEEAGRTGDRAGGGPPLGFARAARSSASFADPDDYSIELIERNDY